MLKLFSILLQITYNVRVELIFILLYISILYKYRTY